MENNSWVGEWIDEQKNVQTYQWMHRVIEGWMGGLMDEWKHEQAILLHLCATAQLTTGWSGIGT